MPTVIIDFVGFDIPRKPFQIDINIKAKALSKNWINIIRRHQLRSAEFGTFPCHITLPNAWEFFATLCDCMSRSVQPLCHLKV